MHVQSINLSSVFRCLQPEECTDRPEVYLRSLPQFKTQWALGFRVIIKFALAVVW